MSKKIIQTALEEEAKAVSQAADLWPALQRQLNTTSNRPEIAPVTPLVSSSAKARNWRNSSWLLTAAAVIIVLVGLVLIGILTANNTNSLPPASTATPNNSTGPNYKIILKAAFDPTPEQLNKSQQVIEQRLQLLGGKNIKVMVGPDKTIAVEVASIKDEGRLRQFLIEAGRVEFIDTGNQLLSNGTILESNFCAAIALYPLNEPVNCEIGVNTIQIGGTVTPAPIVDQKFQTIITGNELDPAKCNITTQPSGQMLLNFGMLSKASDTLYNFTSKNIGKNMAILLDGRVISSATVQGGIKDSGTITNGTWKTDDKAGKAEAENLLLLLKSGELTQALNITNFSKS